MYMSTKTRNAAPVEKGQFSDKFIHDTKVGYALNLAEILLMLLMNFLSGKSSNIDDSDILIEKGINASICYLAKDMHHKKTRHQKTTELVLHGDIKNEKNVPLFYTPENNRKYCDPNNLPTQEDIEENEKIKITKDKKAFYMREEKYRIFKFLQRFIFKMYHVYVYDASKIMSDEKYSECAKKEREERQSSIDDYLGIRKYCENIDVRIIFSRTPIEKKDLKDPEDFLWFEQPDEIYCSESPGFHEYYKQLKCLPEFKEFFKEKLIDFELIHIKKLIDEKIHCSSEIEGHFFGADLTCLSLDYTEKIKNFQSENNLKFDIKNEKMFSIKFNKNSKEIIDKKCCAEMSKHMDDKLGYVENLKNPNETKYDHDNGDEEEDCNNYDNYDNYCESTEMDDVAPYPRKIIIELFGQQKEFQIHENPAQVIYVDNKPFIVIGNIAYEKQPNSPFIVGNVGNSDNSPENFSTTKPHVEIIIGSHHIKIEISDLKLFSFENYCIGPNDYAYEVLELPPILFE